jgi:hypothetical protein
VVRYNWTTKDENGDETTDWYLTYDILTEPE